MTKRFVTAAGAALVLSLASASGAAAQPFFTTPGAPPEVEPDEVPPGTVLFWGFDFLEEGFGADGGFVHALDGNMWTPGWLVTGSAGYSEDDNKKVMPTSSTESFRSNLLVGYQWMAPERYYLAVYGGISYIDNDETPFFPASETDGSEVGAMVQVDFSTQKERALYAAANAVYTTAFNEVWARFRTGYSGTRVNFGPEFTVSDDEGGGATTRYGAFIGDIDVGRLNMTVSGGYNEEDGDASNDGFYAMLEFSTDF